MNKVLITGTGRSGTTFLMKILTYLGMDTGFTIKNYEKYIQKNCNAGLERAPKVGHRIIKSLFSVTKIELVIQKHQIEYIIIPIRDYLKAAQSREKHGQNQGGFWKARNVKEQVRFFRKIMSDYIYYMTKYDIPTIFIDFDRMISDSSYLYEKLKPILKNISYEKFSEAYLWAEKTSKPS